MAQHWEALSMSVLLSASSVLGSLLDESGPTAISSTVLPTVSHCTGELTIGSMTYVESISFLPGFSETPEL